MLTVEAIETRATPPAYRPHVGARVWVEGAGRHLPGVVWELRALDRLALVWITSYRRPIWLPYEALRAYADPRPCPECQGAGLDAEGMRECPECRGTGREGMEGLEEVMT